MHDVIRRQSLREEYQHQQRHHHGAAADAEQAGEEAHGHTDGEVGEPPLHLARPQQVSGKLCESRSGLGFGHILRL